MAFLSGYTKRWEYKVLATKVPSTQTDFPVYVDLSAMPASFWSTVANGGGDIRVTRSDGTTECAREVVSCDTATDTGELHFLADSVDGTTDTVFYIYANGTSADYAVTDTYGRNAVWGDYEFVMHGEDATTTTVVDSTGTYTLTKSSTGNPVEGTGKLGDGQIFTADKIATNYNARTGIGTSDFIVSYWMKFATQASRRNVWMMGTNGTYADIAVTQIMENTDDLLFGCRGTGDGNISAGTTDGDSTWRLYHNKRVGTTGTFYKNGVSAGTQTSTAWGVNLQSYTQIGAYYSTNVFLLTADIDEFRLRASARSPAWITTEYNNQNDHSTFATIGAEETDGGGGGAAFNNFKGFGGL